MFRMKFDTGNAAFEGGPREVCRILGKVRERVAGGFTSGEISDINGNPVGDWSLKYPKHIKKGM